MSKSAYKHVRTYRLCVCMCAWSSCSGEIWSYKTLYDQISPGQELQAHAHTTDDNDIRPHTVQEHNERTSTEFNLVTA
jgi:hypothetical protein